MKRYSVILGIFSSISAQKRDPFFYPDGKHKMVCSAIGCVNDRTFFAQIYLDGVLHTVRPHDRLGDQMVLSISPSAISLQSSDHELTILALNVP